MLRCGSRTIATALPLLLGACVVGPDYEPPATALPAKFARAPGVGVEVDNARWWQGLSDPTLDSLVARALESNLDIEIASARIAQARGSARLARLDIAPRVDVSGAAQRQRVSEATAFIAGGAGGAPAGPGGGGGFPNPSDLYDITVDASWELDFFGRARRSREAAGADLEASIADQQATRARVAAEVVRTYVNLRLNEELLALSEASATAQKTTVSLMRQRLAVGDISEADLAQAEALLASLQAAIPPVEADRDIALNQLAILLGEAPGAIDSILGAGQMPSLPGAPAAGDPAQLLRARPDIIAAERRIAAANARIGVEIAEYFPKISLLGSGGTQASATGDLFSGAASAWSFGTGVSWRILDFGRIDAAVATARGREAEALASYRQTVLAALEETESAFARLIRRRSEAELLAAEVRAQQAVLDAAERRYRIGSSDYLAVLDAERSLNQVQQRLLSTRAAALNDYVVLVKALGGWPA